MQQNKNSEKIAGFRSVRILVFAALLCAISGVMKLIAPSGDTWRISLENFPIIFGGITMGSWIGGVVGIGADLLGCMFRGYAINPLITVASMTVGIVAGAMFKLIKTNKIVSLVFATFLAHLTANVLIKSAVLSSMYGMPLGILFAERLVTYIITASVESVIMVVLYKSKAIKNGIKRVVGYEL